MQNGAPAVVHSDQGPQFVSNVFKRLCEKHQMATSYSSVYHPKGNSIIERVHRTLKDRLRSMQGHCSENIAEATFECNRLNGAFLKIYGRTAVPKCDWPERSEFLIRPTTTRIPETGDLVAIRDKKPKNTLTPRFVDRIKVNRRIGNSIELEDGRKINLHDCILVGRSEVNVAH